MAGQRLGGQGPSGQVEVGLVVMKVEGGDGDVGVKMVGLVWRWRNWMMIMVVDVVFEVVVMVE